MEEFSVHLNLVFARASSKVCPVDGSYLIVLEVHRWSLSWRTVRRFVQSYLIQINRSCDIAVSIFLIFMYRSSIRICCLRRDPARCIMTIMCLHEDVVDDCKQCIHRSLPRILPGEWAINWNNNLWSRSFVSNYFDHFKKRHKKWYLSPRWPYSRRKQLLITGNLRGSFWVYLTKHKRLIHFLLAPKA